MKIQNIILPSIIAAIALVYKGCVKPPQTTTCSEQTEIVSVYKETPMPLQALSSEVYLAAPESEPHKFVIVAGEKDSPILLCEPDSVVYLTYKTHPHLFEKIAERTLQLTNRERRNLGLSKIKLSHYLVLPCLHHSYYMAKTPTYVGHEQTIDVPGLKEYPDLYDRLTSFTTWDGTSYSMPSENVHFSYDTDSVVRGDGFYAEEAFDGMLSSPAHRSAIVSPEYEVMSVGCVIRQLYWRRGGQRMCQTAFYMTTIYM